MGKFIQRHTAAVMMGVTIAVALGAAFFVHQRQSRMADRRVKQVETLADSAISDLSARLEQSSDSTEPQASMFQSALDHLEQLRQSSGNDPRLLLELSKAYESAYMSEAFCTQVRQASQPIPRSTRFPE